MYNFEKAHAESAQIKDRADGANYQEGEEKLHRERIAAISKLDIGDAQKADIMLVALGLKPATELDLFPWNSPPDEVEQILKAADLEFGKKPVAGKKSAYTYAIAQDQEKLAKLYQAEANQNHQEYGELMGYPATAIEASMEKETLDIEESSALPELDGNIFAMKLSRAHYQDEAKQLIQWSEAIKKYAPDLYEALKGN